MLVVIYPFLKGFTYLFQLWLGISFAWSILMVLATQPRKVSKIAWLLFLPAIEWPIAYDT
ncbi:4-hydroxybenzoate polyprenyltransferase [Coxiella-like endosymbiont]|nr:4-hydroxybenzoate polyprenyltransferase [Coxiella-like endosymbiont]